MTPLLFDNFLSRVEIAAKWLYANPLCPCHYDISVRTFDNRSQFGLLGSGNVKPIKRLLKVVHESVPFLRGDVEVAMRVSH